MRHDTALCVQEWNTNLQEYIHNGQQPEDTVSMIQHIKENKMKSIQDQVLCLSSISNYHWWQYIRCDGTKSRSGIHVRLTDHLLYHPSSEEADKELTLKYIPQSPRNRLMYYLYTDEVAALKSTIKQLLKLDNNEETAIEDYSTENEPSSVKRRKYATQVLKVSPQTICDTMGVEYQTVKNSTDRNRNLYSVFSQQLITDGAVQWRKHNDYEDVVIMSDYNASTGILSPLSYVHVTSTKSERSNHPILLKCTCKIYNTIQCAGLSGMDLSAEQDVVLDESMTCMHCRFFKEHLAKYSESLESIASSSILDKKVKKSLEQLNNPVVLLGMAAQNAATKFSVLHEDTVSVIHLYFNEANACFVKCQNGECISRLLNKKKIPKVINTQQSDEFCGHIQTLLANFELIEELFPEYFNGEDFPQDNITNSLTSSNDINMDDQSLDNLAKEDIDGFDANTSCWRFTARSTHQPKDMNDLKLSR